MLPKEKPMTQTEPDRLINRTQMISIAWQHNLRISRSTIHRWANQPDFPLLAGIDGKTLLYRQSEIVAYLRKKLRKIQEAK